MSIARNLCSQNSKTAFLSSLCKARLNYKQLRISTYLSGPSPRAVQIIGCEVFVVAGMEDELQLCKTLGADICINYKIQDFYKRVKDETRKKGVDIILDFSGRCQFQKNLDCLARGGSLVVLGFKIGSHMDVDLSALLEKDVSVIGEDLPSLHSLERRSLSLMS